MNKLFAILLVTLLTSCLPALEPPKSNTDYRNIIGKPIKIGNLEIAQYDFPNMMNWNETKKACETLGVGWRLPTKDELDFLYLSKDKIGGFEDNYYWGRTENGNLYVVWYQNVGNGPLYKYDKIYAGYVRAVRSL